MENTTSPVKLSRRDALKLGAAAVGSTLSASASRAQERQSGGSNRPNFVIFMTDGQRPDEFSYMAGAGTSVLPWDQNEISGMLRTPHTDRIAREGMQCRNAFVVNALCAPGRGAVLTGLYSRSNGVIDNKDRPLADGVRTISDYLHLGLAGGKIPSRIQGRSIVPLIRGNDAGWHKDWLYSYYEFPGPNMVPKNHGVRTERYKLIEYYDEQPPEYELYDLENDPKELHNLYGEPRYRDVTQHLLQRLEELRKETGEA